MDETGRRGQGLQIVVRWLPVVLWMLFIFTVSGPVGSQQNTSRFIVPFLRWIKPDVSERTVHQIQVVVRKTGHLGEYAVLAALLWRARRNSTSPPLNWGEFSRCLLIATAYAATDEFHQSFVAGREGCLRDVFIDAVGACVGLGVVWLVLRWRTEVSLANSGKRP